MKKLLGFLFALVLLASFGGTLWFLHQKAEAEPIVFETGTPSLRTIVKKTVATGSVVPRKEVEIKPQLSGILEELLVEAGDRVKEGDLIAKIRIIPNMVSLSGAENRVSRARIALDDARRERERFRRLRTEGTISTSMLDDAETTWAQAREELQAARDNLELIKKGSSRKTSDSSNTLIRSTLGGMVLEVPVEVGDSVIETNNFNAGTTIATVADMDELIFKGKVDEAEVGKLKEGMALELTIGAIEDQRFAASLEKVAPKGIEENGAVKFEIRAAVTLQDGPFVRANYSANADIVLDKREDVLALDEALLQFEGGAPYVEVEVAPQQFERREVELGLSDGLHAEVLSGLSADEAVKKPQAEVE
ncbi:MAG: efflux RND transporter periplasmic adaptor subunit [Acidobacteriota bacterium]